MEAAKSGKSVASLMADFNASQKAEEQRFQVCLHCPITMPAQAQGLTSEHRPLSCVATSCCDQRPILLVAKTSPVPVCQKHPHLMPLSWALTRGLLDKKGCVMIGGGSCRCC